MTTDDAMDYAACIIGAPAGRQESVIVTLAAEVRRLREENAVYEPAAKNWPAMIARCEAAEAERDAARAEAAQLVKLFNVDTAELREQRYAALQQRDAARAENAEWREGRIPADWLAMHAADKRLYDAARAEAARLREARADDVALVARLSQQVVALRDAITRVLDGPHYIDRDYQDVLLAALDTPAREGGEGR